MGFFTIRMQVGKGLSYSNGNIGVRIFYEEKELEKKFIQKNFKVNNYIVLFETTLFFDQERLAGQNLSGVQEGCFFRQIVGGDLPVPIVDDENKKYKWHLEDTECKINKKYFNGKIPFEIHTKEKSKYNLISVGIAIKDNKDLWDKYHGNINILYTHDGKVFDKDNPPNEIEFNLHIHIVPTSKESLWPTAYNAFQKTVTDPADSRNSMFFKALTLGKSFKECPIKGLSEAREYFNKQCKQPLLQHITDGKENFKALCEAVGLDENFYDTVHNCSPPKQKTGQCTLTSFFNNKAKIKNDSNEAKITTTNEDLQVPLKRQKIEVSFVESVKDDYITPKRKTRCKKSTGPKSWL